MFARIAIRDLVLVAVVVGAWRLLAPLTATEGALADVLGVLLGLSVALACYLGHEWGHLAGALATGSRVAAPASLASPSLFSFDSKANGRSQFLTMSFAGFAMTGVALGVVYGLLPDGWLATRVARGGVLFLTSLTVFVELPLVGWALVRSDLPPVETFPTHRPDPEVRAASPAGPA